MYKRTLRTTSAIGIALAILTGATGCQIDSGGQTLPSPFWQTDDVQYFPAGTEFKLSREAAAQAAAKKDAAAAAGVAPPGAFPPPPGAMVPPPAPAVPIAPPPAPGT